MNSKTLFGFFAVLALPASAAISFTGGTYSENFDSLGGSPWINDTTLPGWYAYISNPAGGTTSYGNPDSIWGPVSSYSGALYENLTYNRYGSSIGQSNASTNLYNLGTSDSALLRSLGTRNTGGHDVVFGVALRNDTGAHIPAALLSFYGEQWQVNANSGDPTMKLDFTYGVFPSFNAALANPNTLAPNVFSNGYTDPAGGAFDFTAFRFGNTILPLDGTTAGNRQLLSGILPVNWGPGEYLVLRWFDDESNTTDAMLAINDLQITAIPEPSAGVLLLGTAAMLLRRTRRGERPLFLQKRLPCGRLAGFLACPLSGFGHDLFQRSAKSIRPVDPERQRRNPVARFGPVERGAVEVACRRKSIHGDSGGKSPLPEHVRHFRNHLVRFLAGHSAVSQTLRRR